MPFTRENIQRIILDGILCKRQRTKRYYIPPNTSTYCDSLDLCTVRHPTLGVIVILSVFFLQLASATVLDTRSKYIIVFNFMRTARISEVTYRFHSENRCKKKSRLHHSTSAVVKIGQIFFVVHSCYILLQNLKGKGVRLIGICGVRALVCWRGNMPLSAWACELLFKRLVVGGGGGRRRGWKGVFISPRDFEGTNLISEFLLPLSDTTA